MGKYEQGVLVKYAPLGHFEATANATPAGLPGIDSLEGARIRRIVIRANGNPIVWTDDGSTPSSTHGQLLLADEVLIYDGEAPEDFSMIRSGSTNADVRVAYYGL